MIEQQRQRQGAERARWLAEMAAALGEARRSVAPLVGSPSASLGWLALDQRLALAIAEVDSLRRGRTWQIAADFPPNRNKFPPEGGARNA